MCPIAGMAVSGTVTLVDHNTLKTEGCALLGLVCQFAELAADTLTRLIG